LRVERQEALQSLDRIDHENARAIEEQHGRGIGGPAHLTLLGFAGHSAQPVDEAFEPAEASFEDERLTLVNAGHVRAQRLHGRDEDGQRHDDLSVALPVHDRASGLSSATNR
jgi:hypothetical protein